MKLCPLQQSLRSLAVVNSCAVFFCSFGVHMLMISMHEQANMQLERSAGSRSPTLMIDSSAIRLFLRTASLLSLWNVCEAIDPRALIDLHRNFFRGVHHAVVEAVAPQLMRGAYLGHELAASRSNLFGPA